MNKQTLDFDQARAKHLQFKARLRSVLYDAVLDEEPILSHYECGVGKWIYSHGLQEFGHIPEMHELEKVHVAIHTIARQLIGFYKEGKVEEARQGLPKMEKVADQLVVLLNVVEEKVARQGSNLTDAGELLEENVQVLRELQSINYDLEKRIQERTVELQKATERYELVGMATQDSVWDWDLKTNQLWWNQRFYVHFGYLKENIPPSVESWYDNIHPEDQERVVKGIHQIIDYGGQQWADEYRFRRADGTYAYVLDRGYALHDEHGKPNRMVGAIQDVTERKRTEQALLESRRKEHAALAEAKRQKVRLERFFMQAPAAICVLDGETLIFELVNPLFQQFFPGRALAGKPILEALSEITDQPIQTILQNVYQTGETFEGKEQLIQLIRREGGTIENSYFNFIYQARFDEQGKIDGILVFAFEVTDQALARQAVEASTRQVRLITDALPVLIGYLDREEKYCFANHAYESWFNRKPETLLGQPVRNVVGEKAYQEVKHYIERALAGERLDFEARMPYRENLVKYIRTSYVPDIQDGSVVGFYTLVNDITEQVEIRQKIEEREKEAQALSAKLAVANAEIQTSNQELAGSNQQLVRTNTDLDNFIYTASHDLKAPISNIEGLMHALVRTLSKEGPLSERTGRIASMMQESVERFKRTIGNLTEVVKLQKENSQDVISVHLSPILQEVMLDLEPVIKSSGAQVVVDIASCPSIRFSQKNLRSVVYNLLSNALKYQAPERVSHVRIHCERTSEYHVLVVADNGLGMETERLGQLFTMFKRFHDHVEGSGIGLYMVKKMVDNAGGKIEVESQVGVGSTFRVYFQH